MQKHKIPLPNATKAGEGKAALPVIEIVAFRLLPNVSADHFLVAVAESAELVASQPGFLGRHLSCDDSGLWTDVITWIDMPKALTAAQTVMADPAFGPLMSAIDPAEVSVRHAQVLLSMSG